MNKDEYYMRRCLQLARNGLLRAKPNPSVGAVIVSADDRIIGEGYTSAYGGPHAEVNAFRSVKAADELLLPGATIYVSLEPCSHWGKTPPCCDLIIRKGVRRVVCGCVDPFAKVQGRGIRKIREAGIEVTVGVLEKECIESNIQFMTVNEKHRPYILLKWAQTVNGFIDDHFRPTMISTPWTQMLSHRLRAEYDSILVGHTTWDRDQPKLNVREWVGSDPKRFVLDHHHPLQWDDMGQSLIVEGGAQTLQSFIDKDLWDEIRVEIALDKTVTDGTHAPQVPADAVISRRDLFDHQLILHFRRR
ncbi:MAG: bifunctional diaminohydroxyphosphoribosylaminopyrimidine deaminase/5-amino-6-(5-phosphoribosylamino)uracil reductase RibD [Prevotellaceae bacterium]|nr:bifunctional diaminohydroxyphosphoribosylaminopyrimidine deaminase/5-amino-6-(5-phosphoribosylamino)uracil reductase RibD [Prevotellaceae bacterium]